MSLPPDLDGATLVHRLRKLGYEPTRHGRSHERLTRQSPSGVHHLTIPLHGPLRTGTLNQILSDVALHVGISRAEAIRQLS